MQMTHKKYSKSQHDLTRAPTLNLLQDKEELIFHVKRCVVVVADLAIKYFFESLDLAVRNKWKVCPVLCKELPKFFFAKHCTRHAFLEPASVPKF